MKIITTCLAMASCAMAFADDFSLYYEATEGAQANRIEAVSNIQKIVFEDGNIVVVRKDGTQIATPTTDINKLYFSAKGTGIAATEADQKPMVIYDLTGRKVEATDADKLQKGLYIIDGKKILVK